LPSADGQTCAAAMTGGAGLSGRKTGRDFQANSEKSRSVFNKEGGHTVPRSSLFFVFPLFEMGG